MSEQPRKPDAADGPVDPELARLYRDAAREEPPQHLDAAILAAARREAGAQPRPLQQPAGGTVSSRMKTGNVPAANRYRRWHVSVALAAVLVLSVSLVTLHREGEEYQPMGAPGAPPAAQERRDAPAPSPQPPASPSARKAVPERRVEDARAAGSAEDSVRSAQPTRREEAAPAAAAEAEAPGGGQPPSSLAAPQARPRMPEEQAGTPAVPTADAPPERWGERIIALRQQGKAAEADALLAEYRRRFPDRVVPEEWTR